MQPMTRVRSHGLAETISHLRTPAHTARNLAAHCRAQSSRVRILDDSGLDAANSSYDSASALSSYDGSATRSSYDASHLADACNSGLPDVDACSLDLVRSDRPCFACYFAAPLAHHARGRRSFEGALLIHQGSCAKPCVCIARSGRPQPLCPRYAERLHADKARPSRG